MFRSAPGLPCAALLPAAATLAAAAAAARCGVVELDTATVEADGTPAGPGGIVDRRCGRPALDRFGTFEGEVGAGDHDPASSDAGGKASERGVAGAVRMRF